MYNVIELYFPINNYIGGQEMTINLILSMLLRGVIVILSLRLRLGHCKQCYLIEVGKLELILHFPLTHH